MIISSNTPANEFYQQIADAMDVRKADLEISYKFSTNQKADSPMILTTPIHVIRLFNKAWEITKALESAPKSKTRKTLNVKILNRSAGKEQGKKDEKPTKKPTKTKVGVNSNVAPLSQS